MLVFRIGILTETERNKVAKCKTATHQIFFFPHNRGTVTRRMHLCGAGTEHKEKPVMQHPILDRHEGSCPKLSVLDHAAAALLYRDDAMAWERWGQQAERDVAMRGYQKPRSASRYLGRACAQRDVPMFLIQLWSLPCQPLPGGREGP